MAELNLIIGPMFSGKTTELLRIAKRLLSIKLRVLLINYSEDTRYSTTEMKTHDNEGMPCIFMTDLINLDYSSYDVICINEGQFFNNLRMFCESALSVDMKIYVSGLDGDFKQKQFGEILDLIPICDNITKLNAFCKICANGKKASFTKRIVEDNNIKLIGAEKMYIPVCREHLK